MPSRRHASSCGPGRRCEPCGDPLSNRDFVGLDMFAGIAGVHQLLQRQVTLFSGEGAIGKSIVELMCSVAHVVGGEWLRSMPEPGGAFYIGCEDDEKELRIRLTPIARHYGTTFEQLKTDGFRFTSLAGEDAVRGAPDRNGIIRPTPLFDSLCEQADNLKPKHIGIDTAADVFAGSENDRAQVRQFISLLRKLTIVLNGSVVLLSHPKFSSVAIIRNLSAISRGKMEHTPMLGSCCFFVARFTDG